MTNIYITEVSIHPEYQILSGKPTTSQLDAINAAKKLIDDEMADEGVTEPYLIHRNSDRVSISYEGSLTTYYITQHEV
jgi:hypothetical protein